MKLISWNIAGIVSKNKDQVEALLSRQPSIICLQEVRSSALKNLGQFLLSSGFEFQLETVTIANENNRKKGNYIASIFPIRLLPNFINSPLQESILSAVVDTPIGSIAIHNVHIPNGSSYKWKKIETFEEIYKVFSKRSNERTVLCGDFNSPQAELPTGVTVTWGQRKLKNNKIILNKEPRWHFGEYSVLRGLEEFNLPDVFRLLHGYVKQDYSFEVFRNGQVISKRRFDHVFASTDLNPVSCKYLHQFRLDQLSDHSPIEVVFLH
jgi:exonuclease III